jgi:hypothetical protein
MRAATLTSATTPTPTSTLTSTAEERDEVISEMSLTDFSFDDIKLFFFLSDVRFVDAATNKPQKNILIVMTIIMIDTCITNIL